VVNVPFWVKLHGVPVTAFSEDGLSIISTKLGTPLMLDSYTCDMCMQSWGRSSYARAMIELRADVKLKDTIVNECPKNLGSDVAKKSKNHSQAPRGVLIDPKVRFKQVKQVYRPVPKRTMSTLVVIRRKMWSQEKSISTTPMLEKINKLEKLIIDGKFTLVDDEGKPLKVVDYPGDHDSEDEVTLGIYMSGMKRGFFSQKGVGGRGVKEKQHGLANDTGTIHVGTGSVNESGNGGNGDGLESSSNGLKTSAVNKDGVANVNVTFSTGVDSIMAGLENLHDENGGRYQVTILLIQINVLLMLNYLPVKSSRKSVNFHTLITSPGYGIDVAVPMESIRAITERFVNMAYGFFLRNRVAYPVISKYFRNTWGKYGLVNSMLNSYIGLFLFHYNSMEGLDSMLENWSWFIHNNPLILKR
nr:hypothetical protein [Tanacetum cinerariifolium]